MKINIDTNSWHYRLMESVNIMPPKKTRSYRRYVTCFIVTLGVISTLLTAPYIVYLSLNMLSPKPSNQILALSAVVLLIIGVIGVVVDFLIAAAAIDEIYTEKIKPKLPKLEAEYIDGKKKKEEKEDKEKLI